jgi:flagellar hook-associated protein 2
MTSVSSTTSLLTSSTSSTTVTTSTSDIDWSGLIEAAVAAKLAKADTIDLKITVNEAKSAAYGAMADLLGNLMTAANALRAPSGSSNSTTDVFNARAAYLTANGDVDAYGSMAATVESGAVTGSYALTVTQLAQAHKVSSTGISSRTEDLGYDGVIALGVEGGGAVEIEIDGGMTLAEIAEAINAVSNTSGVQASVIGVSGADYRIVLSGTETGTTITGAAISGDNVLGLLGLTDTTGDFANVLQDPAQAILSIDGIEIVRSSNDINDVLDGVTLHLYQLTPPGTSIAFEIASDLGAVKDAVVALVEAYNAYREFAFAQQQVPNASNAETTVLFGDVALRNVNAALYAALSATIDTTAMSLLGLTFNSTNALELDENKLDTALLSDLGAIQALLGYQMESSAADLLLLSRGSATPAAFTLDIVTDDDGSIVSASIGGDSSMFTVNGTRIVGASGTAYEGFTFVYAGSSSKSVVLSFSTGLAELLYNATEKAANKNSGTLVTLINQLEETNSTLASKSDDIRTRAETYRTNLTNRYAAYQAAIAQAEALQGYLTTLLDTWNSTS